MKSHQKNIPACKILSLFLTCGLGSSGALAQTPMPTTTPPAAAKVEELKDDAQRKTVKDIRRQLKDNEQFAFATLKSAAKSTASGTVFFTKNRNGINVVASISGLKAGRFGFHIHEHGDCSAADFTSAGDHFNPAGVPHGGPDSKARHAGDLGNITINSAGVGLLNRDFNEAMGFTDWTGIIGKSVVLHARSDDEKTQPAGNAGERIACGVIREIPVETAQR